MERIVWVIGDNRTEILNVQRGINSRGSMKAVCLLSKEALNKAITMYLEGDSTDYIPTLIVIDYEMAKKDDFSLVYLLQKQPDVVRVPMFFMVNDATDEVVEECCLHGSAVVLKKPLSELSFERIERMAWQFDVAKNTERRLERQANDLRAAKEIMRLNKQLEARNELLYQVFGRYFSDEVLERILENPKGASIGGEKKEMTVMMADLRGFMAMSQGMDSDAMMDLLNFYFGKMVDVINQFKGTIIEFLGDGILAVFGAPVPSEHHAENAVAAAIHMQNLMPEINKYCAEKGYEPVAMGIGINTGEVFIGNIGSEKVMRYNVIGGVVNQCSRIERYSVGRQILVSAETLEKISCDYTLGKTLEIIAKGVTMPVKVYEIVGMGGEHPCSLYQEEDFKKYKPEALLCLELYEIVDKLICNNPVEAVVKEISISEALVECQAGEGLEQYADVRVKIKDINDAEKLKDVYAKITGKEKGEMTLCFTHINGSFQNLLKQFE